MVCPRVSGLKECKMFEYNTVVGYSRLNRQKQVPPHEIVNYMQDCTTFHSEAVGMGLQYMESIGKAWLLKAYHIVQEEPVKIGQKITVGTSPAEFRGTFGERQFYIRDEAGNYPVRANSLWILIDTAVRSPIRITDEDKKAYPTEKVFEDIAVNRKLKLSPERTEKGVFPVMKTYIDSNGHMNNAEYLRLIEEILPEDFRWKNMEIVFHKEAMEGEQIHAFLHHEPEGLGISFENRQGETLTTIKMQ